MQASVCNFLSSSAGFNLCSCFFRLTLAFYFRFWLLWAQLPPAFAVFRRLSDPRCFRILSSASVLGSDYSASASSFLSSSRLLPRSGFLRCSVPLSVPCSSPFLLPGFPCIPSGSDLLSLLLVSFRSSLLHSHSRSTGACLPLSLPAFFPSVRFLSSASFRIFNYSASVSSVPALPASASQWLPRCFGSPLGYPVFPILFHPVSRVSFPGSQYLAFCLFPFAPPGFAPAAALPVLTSCFRFRY